MRCMMDDSRENDVMTCNEKVNITNLIKIILP